MEELRGWQEIKHLDSRGVPKERIMKTSSCNVETLMMERLLEEH